MVYDLTTDLFFDAFGNHNRFMVLNELMKGPECPSDLQKKLNIEQSNLSHDLKCLVNCRFVDIKRQGRKRVYSLTPETAEIINEINTHIEKYRNYLKKCNVLKEEKNGKI